MNDHVDQLHRHLRGPLVGCPDVMEETAADAAVRTVRTEHALRAVAQFVDPALGLRDSVQALQTAAGTADVATKLYHIRHKEKTLVKGGAAATCTEAEFNALTVARNWATDLAMLRIRLCVTDIYDRDEFIEAARVAYGRMQDGQWEKIFHGQVLLAYQKDQENTNRPGFCSNNSLHPRTRGRTRNKNPENVATRSPTPSMVVQPVVGGPPSPPSPPPSPPPPPPPPTEYAETPAPMAGHDQGVGERREGLQWAA